MREAKRNIYAASERTLDHRQPVGVVHTHLVDGDLQPGAVVRHRVGQPEPVGGLGALRPVRFVGATVDVGGIDGGLAADHDDAAAVAVGVEVDADSRVPLGVCDLRGIGR